MTNYNNIRVCANIAGKLEIPHIRRKSISELVYWLQDIEIDNNYHPGADGLNKLIYEARTAHEILKEIRRRKDMPAALANTNSNIIAAIKERADIVEVLEQFTEVFTHQRQWTYRCTLHGKDEHPSGVIYKDENRAHCFSCQKGGDAIDIVCHFGRTDTPGAISWLCRFYGLDHRVLPAHKPKGGTSLATTEIR